MYHLFAGQGYYPMAGLGDYVGPRESLEDAIEEGRALLTRKPNRSWGEQDWFVVVAENEDGRLVELSYAYGPLDPED